MNSVIAHVGFPKTGTTYLQQKVLSGAKVGGWFAGTKGADDCLEYRDFQFGIKSAEEFDVKKYTSSLINKINGEGVEGPVIISDETLYSSRMISLSARRLHDAFPQATILFTIRNQYSALQSLYFDSGRFIFQGTDRLIQPRLAMRTRSFREFIESYSVLTNSALSTDEERNHFQYGKGIDIYAHYFGVDRIRILLYEDLLDNPKIWYEAFEGLGLTGLEFRSSEEDRVNRRSSYRETRYWQIRSRIPIRSFEQLLGLRAGQVTRVREWLKKGRSNVEYSKEMNKLVQSIFGEGNQRLASRWGLDLESRGYPVK